MNPNHLLIVVLTPLLICNAALWTVYAHQPVIALMWLGTLWACHRWLPND